MLGNKKLIIQELEEENKYWKERCERFRSVLQDYGIERDPEFTAEDELYLREESLSVAKLVKMHMRDEGTSKSYSGRYPWGSGKDIQSHDDWVWDRIRLLINAIKMKDTYSVKELRQFFDEIDTLLEEQIELMRERHAAFEAEWRAHTDE